MRIRARRDDPEDTARAPGDELTAELTTEYWDAYDQRLAETSFLAMARQLPELIGQAIRLGWAANRRDTVATIGLNLVSGVLTGFALLATTGVLEALFAAGPTPARVRAALPSLLLVGAAVAARAGLQAAAGWAQARLEPQANRVVEIRLFDLTSRVELSAFDDSAFYDAMERARDRGLYAAPRVLTNVLNCVTGVAGIVSAALVVACSSRYCSCCCCWPNCPAAGPRCGRPGSSTSRASRWSTACAGSGSWPTCWPTAAPRPRCGHSRCGISSWPGWPGWPSTRRRLTCRPPAARPARG